MNRLSDRQCKAAVPPTELHDGGNLVLRVGVRRRTWTLVWESAGKVRKARLGEYPALGLAAARVAAQDAMGRVRRGLAPVEIAAAPAAPQPPLTVETVLRTYLARHIEPTAKDPDQVAWVIDTLLKPLHAHDAAGLARADVTAFLDRTTDDRGAASAYRAGSVLRAACRFGVRRGDLATDPTHLILLPAPGEPRDRVLTEAETAAVWASDVPVWSRLARVLLLSGLRLREAAEAPCAELATDVWLIPKERMKGGRAHVVPLYPALRAQIGDTAGQRWLFKSPRRFDQPASGFTRGLQAVHTASGTSGWTWHDLRRTVASGLERAGAPFDVTEAVLAHRKPGVSAVYLRHDFLAERRAWLSKWAETLIQHSAVGGYIASE